MYTDLAHVRVEIKATAADTSGDAYVLDAIRQVCARIDKVVGYEFAPRLKERLFDAEGCFISADHRLLLLDEPLLAVTTLVNALDETLTTGDYTLHTMEARRGTTPYDAVRLTDKDASWSDYDDNNGPEEAISITGTWGFHRHYADAWLASGDAVANGGGINASVTSITVSDADGADAEAWTPRFSPGQLIQIGTEWLSVEAVNVTTNVLTVRRGQRGSTAAVHAAAAPISIWRADELIQRAAIRWVAFIYARRGVFEQVSYDGVATVRFPASMPQEVQDILDDYPRFGGLLKAI